MSDIATKLITVAENTPAVADAVNAAKATASGAVVRVDDVLNMEHPLQVQLRSDTLTDFSGKAVKVYGKNLLRDDVKDWSNYDSGGNYLLSLPAGTYTVWGDFDNDDSEAYVYLKKSNDGGSTWVVSDPSISTILPSGATNSTGYIATGTNASRIVSFAVTDDPNEKWCIWTTRIYINRINFLQLERGAAATQYEPYKEPQTATADARGKVTGLHSVSPTMTLMADSDAVTVECTYFPTSAAQTCEKYEALKAEQTALQEYLTTHRRM